jgi:hypothetical protein
MHVQSLCPDLVPRLACPIACWSHIDFSKNCALQSVEIMNLVELIGLGEGNKTSLGRLKNDVKRSVRKTLSAKTRDVLKDVEPRLTVCTVLCGCH